MNIKFLTFALACGLAAAQPPPPPHEHPNCTVGTDAPACTLPDGTAGMFLCHPHPFHEHGHHHHDEDDHGGILGAFRHVVGHMTGHHHPSGSHHEGHGHHGHHHGHHGGSHKGPHRQLRSGSSSSSSSSSHSSSFHHGPHGGMGHGHGPHGHGPHGMERQGPPGGMGPPHGPHGHGPCGHGPPGKLLSDSHCVPVDGPPMDHPFHPPHHGHHDHPHDPPTCGCCGDVCPAQLDCGCTCDLTDWDGNVLEKGAGVWVTVTLKDKSTLKKCVHAGAYADANRVQCVTDCTADDLVEEAKAMELMEENFGEEEDLEEKESRD